MMPSYPETLSRALVLDELADLSLYRHISLFAKGEIATLLTLLIPIEERHYNFWQDFFRIKIDKLDWYRQMRLIFLVAFCRLFGEAGINLVLEAIEINGVKKYLSVWEHYQDNPLGVAVREILQDELGHEDQIVSDSIRRRVHPERVRDIFLGLNDGLVEILGAVSGFFIAFQSVSSVLAASLTVTVAGAFSMAAGAYVAAGSESEAADIERRKEAFLAEKRIGIGESSNDTFTSATIVGISYFFGALVPILPVFFGAKSLILSAVISAVVVVLVSSLLAFLSGMNVRRRILINLAIVSLAVLVTAVIGHLAKTALGIDI